MVIWNNLWPLHIVCGHLLYFSQFGMLGPRKIWQPWARGQFLTGFQAKGKKFAPSKRCSLGIESA
jgi:hypothetical protein